VRVFLRDKVAQGRHVTNEVADDGATMARLCARKAKRDVGGCEWVGRDNSYRGVAAKERSDLSSGVFPCDGAPAGHARAQGEPS
jgi:hypothetical protein